MLELFDKDLKEIIKNALKRKQLRIFFTNRKSQQRTRSY